MISLSGLNSEGYRRHYGVKKDLAAKEGDLLSPTSLLYGHTKVMEDNFMSLLNTELVPGKVGFLMNFPRSSLIVSLGIEILESNDSLSGLMDLNLYDSDKREGSFIKTLFENCETDHTHYRFMDKLSDQAPAYSFLGITPSSGETIKNVTFKLITIFAT